jgi:hypothetical protein
MRINSLARPWSEPVIREVVVSSSNAPQIDGMVGPLRGDAGLCSLRLPNAPQTAAQSERLETLFTINKETTVSHSRIAPRLWLRKHGFMPVGTADSMRFVLGA